MGHVSSSIVQYLSLLGYVICTNCCSATYSKASHSELVTNIVTMICVAVRHCQSTSNSVASPHKKIAGWPSHF